MTNTIRAAIGLLVLVLLPLSTSSGETKGGFAEGDLVFHVKAIQPVFDLGNEVALEFRLKNVSPRKVLATRAASLHDFVYLEVLDAQHRRIGWQGKIPSREYPPDFFVVLEPGKSATFRAVISYSNGSGYEIKKPGTYRVRAIFSLAPKEYFAPVSNGAVVPDRAVRSNWATFSVVARDSERAHKAR